MVTISSAYESANRTFGKSSKYSKEPWSLLRLSDYSRIHTHLISHMNIYHSIPFLHSTIPFHIPFHRLETPHHHYQSNQILSLHAIPLRSREELYIVHDVSLCSLNVASFLALAPTRFWLFRIMLHKQSKLDDRNCLRMSNRL